MAEHLDRKQLEHLRNTLYINFNGIEVRKETVAQFVFAFFIPSYII